MDFCGTSGPERARLNTLLDVGYTFKLESPTEQQQQQNKQQQSIESRPQTKKIRESPPSDEEEIEIIPRQKDPYIGNVDYLSRVTLDYCGFIHV